MFPGQSSSISDLDSLIKTKGLAALASHNPIGVYGVAAHRSASNDWDYVYGIQQIFGFRLGQSNTDADMILHYPRPELEDQLGQHPRFPISSRKVSFLSTPSPLIWVKASMSASRPLCSRLIRVVIIYGHRINEPRCCFSTRTIDGSLWGCFEGIVCTCISRRCV